ncbi:spindle and kinetochore-associated protein 1 [Pocillopora verrucosa]|uniref:spindle and kinetochore-associated protein 1 n=1 Tax=Pocillopora verrucosa TaxID=203993 RepID=UPI0033425285
MAATLEQMAEIFSSKISSLKRCMELRGAASSANCDSVLRSLDKELLEIESSLSSFQAHLEKEKKLVEQGEVMQDVAKKFKERLEHIASNLPSHLPGVEKISQRVVLKEEVATENVKKPRKTRRAKDLSSEDGFEFPKLAYLTVEEFDQIPKYIKGRTSYDQVNNAIDEIHKVITAKYKILRLPRSAMGEPVMKKFKAFKEAEIPDIEGEYFFIDDDLKTYSQMKMDSTGRAILTMLRHCGRLREVRGKKLLRYVLKL